MSQSAQHKNLVQERKNEMNADRVKRGLPELGTNPRTFYMTDGNGGRDAYERWLHSFEGRGYHRRSGDRFTAPSAKSRNRNKNNREPKTSNQNDSAQFLKALGVQEFVR